MSDLVQQHCFVTTCFGTLTLRYEFQYIPELYTEFFIFTDKIYRRGKYIVQFMFQIKFWDNYEFPSTLALAYRL